jgi:cytochrome c-type biogenesis protein CcmF
MTVLGQAVTYLALFSALGAALGYYRATRTRTAAAMARRLLNVSAGSVLAASGILTYLLLTHDFRVAYVFSYSDRALPLHFLLSSFYAGQEGSFLFWALCTALFAFPLASFARKREDEPWVMTVYMGVMTGLLMLVAAKSPFRPLWEAFPDAPVGVMPADGRGLNPLLQNFWMVIHPPVLFIGFAAMAAPFSLAIAGLWKKDFDILTVRGLPWVLTAVALLGLGIMLGGYWAYGVLGWGGYWGWDPVENSSLVPWITGLALVHTLLAQRRTGKYRRTNFVLAILSFLLVIYSTFLTRSGILGDASVHSFTDPGSAVYWLLLGFLAAIITTGAVAVLSRLRDLRPAKEDVRWWTRETALGAGAIVLLLSALVVLFGTSLPVVSSTRVEPSFYDQTNLPIAILIGILVGFSLFAQWEIDGLGEVGRRAWKSLLASLCASAVLWFAGLRDPLMLGFAFSAVFTIAANAEIGWKVAKGDPLFLGGKIAHIGLALFFLGVISTGRYSQLQHASLPLNTPVSVLGHTLTYTGHVPLPDGKFGFRVTVEGTEGKLTMMPVMFETGSQGQMRNPDIASFLTRDLYLSPVSVESGVTGDEVEIPKGGTADLGRVRLTFVRFQMGEHAGASASVDGMKVGAVLEITDGILRETITPVLVYRPGQAPHSEPLPSTILQGSVRLTAIGVGQGSSGATFVVERSGAPGSAAEALVVEASLKPWIVLVWAGMALITIGFVMAILKRMKEAR